VKRRPFTALIAGLVLAGAVPLYSSAAAAIPPDCADGSPPPCNEPPDPETTTTTTGGGGGGTPAWRASVSVLDQTADNANGGGFNHYLTGAWRRQGSPTYSTPSGRVAWAPGTGDLEGTLPLTSTYLPAGQGGPIAFLMRELGAGVICRSQTGHAVLPSGGDVHILLGDPVSISSDELSELAGGFLGEMDPAPDGADEVRIDQIDLTAQNGRMALVINGYLEANVPNWPDDIDDDFTYVAKLGLYESIDAVHTRTVEVSTHESSLALDNWGSDAEEAVRAKFRPAVESAFEGAFDAEVASRPEIRWFDSLGYTVSFRRITITTAGIEVLPALCLVEG
jgi:hypothetical protein